MEYLYQKVSYLRGLAEGLGIDEKSKEGKLLLHMVNTLEDFAEVIDEVSEDYNDLEQYVNYIDEDLSDVEDELYDLDYDDFYYSDEDFDDEYYDDLDFDADDNIQEFDEE